MNSEKIKGVHWSFWLISVAALLWNIGGAINYIMQMDIDFVSTLPESHRAIIEGRPTWATAGFAIGVFGGALGCLLLLFRKSYALYLFIVSLTGILVTMVHTVNVANTKINFTAPEIFIMIVMPVIVAAMLIWYAKLAMRKSWIN